MTSTSTQKHFALDPGAAPQYEPVTALHASNNRFRVIFDAVVDGIFLTDPATGRVTEVNASGCAMFGYEKSELVGLDIAALSSGIYPYTLEVSQATTSQSVRGDVRMMEWQCRRKDGTLFWAELSKHYTRIGRQPVNITSLRDITERKAIDRKLAGALHEAAAASEAKSAFLANMSHELRTPLNAVIGFSDLMLSQTQALVPKHVEYMGDIRSSGLHLLALIDDILDLAKIDAHALVIEKREVSLRHVIADACRMVRAQARLSGLEIQIDVDSGLDHVWGDERRLRQILLNLLSNALKFTERKGKVSIRARNVAGAVCCEITDDGIGIAPEELSKVTERFGQVDNKFSRMHQGAGLGLPLVKELVELHDGSFHIESELGKGTKVTVCIPSCNAVATTPNA
jgi:PAS domain S-box-containing protein